MNAVIKAAHIKKDIGTGQREVKTGWGRKLYTFFLIKAMLYLSLLSVSSYYIYFK